LKGLTGVTSGWAGTEQDAADVGHHGEARNFCAAFIEHYNNEHRRSGVAHHILPVHRVTPDAANPMLGTSAS
jgi:hypothetical protein